METVKQFGNELNGILDSRPPVSRAKMASITKLAMKSHKYYKHIVMLVEKFISKSSSEYKVPGLYVIDSIMRQSRHQFGTSKDSFGPRFTKNFEKTFLHLFQCPEEDKPKIVRVLNLWQKNEVFPPEVIQPLLALASSDTSHIKPKNLEQHRDRPVHSLEQHQDKPHEPDLVKREEGPSNNPNLDLSTATTIIQQQQEQISALLQQQQQLQTQATSLLAPALSSVLVQQQHVSSGGVQQLEALSSLLQQTQQLQQLQALQQRLSNGDKEEMGVIPAQISNAESISHGEQPSVFNKAVLDDFDYSDDEDSLDRASRLVRQKERETVAPLPSSNAQESDSGSPSRPSPLQQETVEPLFPPTDTPSLSRESMPHPPPPISAINREAHSFSREMVNSAPPPPPSSEPFAPAPPPHHSSFPPPHNAHPRDPPSQIPPGPPPPRDWSRQHPPPPLPPHFPPPPHSPPPRMRQSRFSSPPPMMGRSPSPPHHRHWREREREHSRWSSPPRRHSPPRRRSRSPPMHLRRHSRDRSRSPPHSRWHRPPTPPENQERRRKGIPFPREKHMTVCSTTLWVGHLSKLATKDTVKEAFEDFGQIKSVELVQARGCAYLVMMHRNDAIRALNSLRDLKLGGTTCKLAWAPGRGVKGSGLKAFWDQEVGSSYIPWSFIKTQADVDTMADGGWIDPLTFPPGIEPPQIPIEEEEEPEAVAPPVPVDPIQQRPPQPPMRNIMPPSLPPQLNVPPTPSLPPQPPVNINPPIPTSMSIFPQLMNPTASFQQPPEKFIPHFPPRGVPTSQPAFSQPNGVPFHGSIQPPMAGEPPPTMPQPMHHPPLMGGPVAPRAPQYTQVPMPQMNRPQMMSGMPQLPHSLPQPPIPHQMMQPSTGRIPPFVPPNMGGPAQQALHSPLTQVTHTFPQPIPQPPMASDHTAGPIRPLMPPRMGEPPHAMAPHVDETRPFLAPLMGEGPHMGREKPLLPTASNPVLPVDNEPHVPLKPAPSDEQLPSLMGEHPPIPPKEPSPLPPPMEEEPKEPSPLTCPMDEEPNETSPIPPSMDEEPKQPSLILQPMDDEPIEPSPIPPGEQLSVDGEPKSLPPTVVEEPKEPSPLPTFMESSPIPPPVEGNPSPAPPPGDKGPESPAGGEQPKETSPVAGDIQQEPSQPEPNELCPFPPSSDRKSEPFTGQSVTDKTTAQPLPHLNEELLPEPQGQVGTSAALHFSLTEEPQCIPQTHTQEPDNYPIVGRPSKMCPHPPEEPQSDKPHPHGTTSTHEDEPHTHPDQQETNKQSTKAPDEQFDTVLSDDDMQIETTDEELEVKITTSPYNSEFL